MPASSLLEKKLSEEPIILPSSPFLEVLRVFGRDQLSALGINVVATAVISGFVNNYLILSIAGPVIEKIGFFIAYFKEAREIYATTPKSQRLSKFHYLSIAFRKGLSSLSKDIVAHDPLYALFMWFGLIVYPETPAWILSISSFILALCIVAVGEVVLKEIRYHAQILKYRRAGFSLESYFESRFYIKNADPQKILADLSEKFNLTEKISAKYHDRYFETNLKKYNGRKPVFRLRQRTTGEDGQMQTLQIVYTKASEMAIEKLGQFNYYPTKKDKAWIGLNQEMPWRVEDIIDQKIKNICNKMVIATRQDVFFEREVIRNPKNVLVSIDKINLKNAPSFTMVEIKSHSDDKSKKILIEVMRYVMLKYEVIQTTYDKNMLTSLGVV